MIFQLRAHFDGRVLIPDEPVDIPVNEPLTLQISTNQTEPQIANSSDAAFERLLSRVVPNANIPAEALRRENLYESR